MLYTDASELHALISRDNGVYKDAYVATKLQNELAIVIAHLHYRKIWS